MSPRLPNVALIVALSAALVSAQTRIVPPPNKYSVAEDVKLGREAAAEARKELPVMRDDAVTSYVQDLGQRLVAAIPPEFHHDEFEYTFEAVNVREINAFALPGGPMFVNRGMIEAANTEGEVAGVMAHEISHVVLRHGTAQASKAGKYQAGAIAGAIFGAIVGGSVGSVISQGTQFGLGAMFMRYGRDFEKQADLEGAQIMARAGYDPRDMANMFRTIEKTSGSSGPEWLSDHPNPGNRSEYITQEARALRIEHPITETARFDRIKEHLQSLPKAPTSEEAARARKTSSGGGASLPRPSGTVAPPSSRYTQYTAGNVFRVSVPSNWQQRAGSSAVTYAPDGAYGAVDGQSVFTHGIEFGLARGSGSNLQSASQALVDSFTRGNPRMRGDGRFRRSSLGGQSALSTTLDNVSEATDDRESIELVTTQLRDGSVFYAITVAPERESTDYADTFQRVMDSVRFLK